MRLHQATLVSALLLLGLCAICHNPASAEEANRTRSTQPLLLRSTNDLIALRQLDRRIDLLEAELAVQQHELNRVGPTSTFRYSTAFLWTLDSASLAAVHVSAELQELRDERSLLQRGASSRR